MPDERYEPLPSLPALPGWLWRRMSRGVRIAAAIASLAVLAAGIAAAPAILEAGRDRERQAERERAERRQELVLALEAEQTPILRRSGAVAPPGSGERERLAARAAMLDELSAAIGRDARRRVREGVLDGPIRRVACEPFPRSTDRTRAERDLSLRGGRYACIAVTAEFERSEGSLGGVIGHQYRARLDFQTGRYGFCKITGLAGPERERPVTIARRCGGD